MDINWLHQLGFTMKNNKHKLAIIITSFLIMMTGINSNLVAKSNTVPEPFQGQNKDSKISISYDDYSYLLRMSVLALGKSKRAKAPKTVAKIGSRSKAKRQSIYTATEGNRLLFRNFKTDENKAILTKIRKSLEKVSDEVAMSELNAREQLAYWLNLYNISLIEQLVDIYPQKNIEDALYSKKGIMQNKFLTVSGIKLSLDDIQNKIIHGKFPNSPLVIYGLFQGTIGGPSIRNSAYTGDSVIKQLRQNASEFINSNRGTYKGKKGTLRVSSFYDMNSHLFPDFKNDLKKHLSPLIDDNYSQFLDTAKRIKPNIKVLTIADLIGGQRKYSSSSATNEAAFLGSAAAQGTHQTFPGQEEGSKGGFVNPSTSITSEAYRSLSVDFGRYDPEELKTLLALKDNTSINKGSVIIKEEAEKKGNKE